jgi:hypothetical protein
MTETTTVEKLLRDAIGLLVSSGYPHAADHLRSSLAAIANAPTAAAKRRRVLQLVETLERSETEARYRRLLERIRELADGSDRAA